MRKICVVMAIVLAGAIPLAAQGTRLWVMRSPGEMVEYDPANFSVKLTLKVPVEAWKSPGNLSVNRMGQMLFATAVSLPLSEEDEAVGHKVWIWNGHAESTIAQGVEHKNEETGSNQAVIETAPVASLSADGSHLYWFASRQRRLEREGVDLSTTTTFEAWQTDLGGEGREEVASVKLPDCRCPTGTCEESCPVGMEWIPSEGVDNFFLVTQFVAGQTSPEYKSTSRYQKKDGKWTATEMPDALERVLDATQSGSVLVEAIPDAGCCGWSNESNDQTFVLLDDKKVTVFDEQATYKNPDYDVSFFTSNARLSPDMGSLAMTVTATAEANQTIQLAEQGQANPEESQRIRKALADLPAVVVKSLEASPRQIALVPHATLVGWISDKELLIVQDHLLVAYHVGTGAKRKSSVRVDDPGKIFLR